jgi:hypothetical protein
LLHGIDGVAAQYGREVNALHTVSVWAHDQGVVSGSAQVPEKSNEITVIPELLETLDINGAVATIDAMGTQKQAGNPRIGGCPCQRGALEHREQPPLDPRHCFQGR